jgi:uncharacterized protein (DUF362 family)
MANAVVITAAEKLNYMHNFVALPYDYGRASYFNRLDVKAIRKAVFESLDTLAKATGFDARFKGCKVLIKPNLVAVMRAAVYNTGYDIPQTTDPRVFEAVIAYLKQLTDDITIAESGGITTRAGFRETGYDRIAKYYGTKLIPLEEQPLDRYYVPKAEIQKEAFLPRIMREVLLGEMRYVSVPKMKTNLYTEVSLGVKNAMGILPTRLRHRNHTWQINKKLIDILYLFQPDLTVIDGIIGGEGLTPGPIDPVPMGVILTGTNGVEVDRVATRMMGFDPDRNELLIEATKKGFGDPHVQIIGEQKIVKFRPADASLLSERFKKNWPNIKLYVGHNFNHAPRVADVHNVPPETVRDLEQSCRGGCLATMGMAMEMFLKAKNTNTQTSLAIVLGGGVESNGQKYWFDGEGEPYDLAALKALDMKKFCAGSCTSAAASVCDVVVTGCGDVQELTLKLLQATRLPLPILSMENEGMPLIIVALFERYFAIRKVVKNGDITDIPLDATSYRIFEIPGLSEEDRKKDWILAPMKFTPEQVRENLKNIKFAPL